MSPALTCFLIDDDIDDREIFEMALKEIDDSHICITANNGIEAIEKLRNDVEFIPDFIFLDLNMPRMNGRQCLEEIKKIPHVRNVPVIIYSTSSEQRDMEETQKMGAAHFLTKPPSINTLSATLSQFFRQPETSFVLHHAD
jgi:CheY-like chemotaxis protein